MSNLTEPYAWAYKNRYTEAWYLVWNKPADWPEDKLHALYTEDQLAGERGFGGTEMSICENQEDCVRHHAEIDQLRQQLAECQAALGKDGSVCDECDGSGWVENRVEGRVPCICMTEAEPYQLLQQQLADRDEQISDLTVSSDTYFAERNSARDVWRRASKDRDELRQQLAISEGRLHDVAELCATVEQERDTAWAQAHRLALELECLIMDTKDNAVVSKWWDSAFEAIEEYQTLKPGADEESEAWAKIRKVGISG